MGPCCSNQRVAIALDDFRGKGSTHSSQRPPKPLSDPAPKPPTPTSTTHSAFALLDMDLINWLDIDLKEGDGLLLALAQALPTRKSEVSEALERSVEMRKHPADLAACRAYLDQRYQLLSSLASELLQEQRARSHSREKVIQELEYSAKTIDPALSEVLIQDFHALARKNDAEFIQGVVEVHGVINSLKREIVKESEEKETGESVDSPAKDYTSREIEVREELERKESQVKQWMEVAKMRELEVTELGKTVDTLAGEANELKAVVTRNKFEAVELRESIEKLKIERKTTEETINLREIEVRNLQETLETLKTERKTIEETLHLREVYVKELLETIEKVTAERKTIEELLHSREVTMRELHETIEVLKSEQQITQETLHLREIDVAKLREGMEKLKVERKSAEETLHTQEITVRELQETIETMESERKTFEETLHLREIDIVNLRETIETLKTSRKSEEETQNVHEIDVGELQETIERLKNEHKSMGESLHLREKEVAELRETIERLKNERKIAEETLHAREISVTELQETIETLKIERKTMEETLHLREIDEKELRGSMEKLKIELIATEEAQHSKEVQVRELQEAIETLKIQQKTVEETLNVREIDITELRGTIETLKNERKSVEETLHMREIVVRELQETIENLTTERKIIEETHSVREVYVKELQETIETLKIERTAIEESLHMREIDAKELRGSIEKLKTELIAVEETLSKREIYVKELRETIEKVTKEHKITEETLVLREITVKELKETIEMLQIARKTVEETLNTRELTITELQETIEKLKKEHQAIEETLHSREVQVRELQGTIETLKIQQKTVEETLKMREMYVKELLETIETLKTERTTVEETMRMRELDAKELRETIEKVRKEHKITEDTLVLREITVKELQETIETLQIERKTVEETLHQREVIVHETQETIEKLIIERKQVEETVNLREITVKELKETIETLQIARKTVEDTLHTRELTITELQETIEKLKNEHQTVEETLHLRDVEIGKLRGKVEKRGKKIANLKEIKGELILQVRALRLQLMVTRRYMMTHSYHRRFLTWKCHPFSSSNENSFKSSHIANIHNLSSEFQQIKSQYWRMRSEVVNLLGEFEDDLHNKERSEEMEKPKRRKDTHPPNLVIPEINIEEADYVDDKSASSIVIHEEEEESEMSFDPSPPLADTPMSLPRASFTASYSCEDEELLRPGDNTMMLRLLSCSALSGAEEAPIEMLQGHLSKIRKDIAMHTRAWAVMLEQFGDSVDGLGLIEDAEPEGLDATGLLQVTEQCVRDILRTTRDSVLSLLALFQQVTPFFNSAPSPVRARDAPKTPRSLFDAFKPSDVAKESKMLEEVARLKGIISERNSEIQRLLNMLAEQRSEIEEERRSLRESASTPLPCPSPYRLSITEADTPCEPQMPAKIQALQQVVFRLNDRVEVAERNCFQKWSGKSEVPADTLENSIDDAFLNTEMDEGQDLAVEMRALQQEVFKANILLQVREKNTKEKPLTTLQLLKFFEEMMGKKFEGDCMDLKSKRCPKSIPVFIMEYLTRLFGLRKLAIKLINQLIPTLEKCCREKMEFAVLFAQLAQIFHDQPAPYILAVFLTRKMIDFEHLVEKNSKEHAKPHILHASKEGKHYSFTGGEALLSDILSYVYSVFDSDKRSGLILIKALKPSTVATHDYVLFHMAFKLTKIAINPDNLFALLENSGSGEETIVTGLRRSLDLWVTTDELTLALRQLLGAGSAINRANLAAKVTHRLYQKYVGREELVVSKYAFLLALIDVYRTKERQYFSQIKTICEGLSSQLSLEDFLSLVKKLDPAASQARTRKIFQSIVGKSRSFAFTINHQQVLQVLERHPVGVMAKSAFCE